MRIQSNEGGPQASETPTTSYYAEEQAYHLKRGTHTMSDQIRQCIPAPNSNESHRTPPKMSLIARHPKLGSDSFHAESDFAIQRDLTLGSGQTREVQSLPRPQPRPTTQRSKRAICQTRQYYNARQRLPLQNSVVVLTRDLALGSA